MKAMSSTAASRPSVLMLDPRVGHVREKSPKSCILPTFNQPRAKLMTQRGKSLPTGLFYNVFERSASILSQLISLTPLKMSNPSSEPEGALVSSINAIAPYLSKPDLVGQHVTLTPLLEEHATDLYTNLGATQDAALYKYLSGGPYTDLASFAAFIKLLGSDLTAIFPYAIISSDPNHRSNQNQKTPSAAPTPVGIITLLNINVPHRSIEIGHVLFASSLQRTTASTETVFLLMQHAFEQLHFLRVEWKCNDFNKPSARAALRLGFVFEGVFRKHMIIKGRRRDTAWFSVTDEEWESGVKMALVKWMGKANFDGEGKQKRKLEDIREALAGKQ